MRSSRARGRVPGGSRDAVLALTRAEFLACRRIDVQAIARACGVGRATVYRWFGSRDRLIGEAMFSVVSQRVAEARAIVPGRGAQALVDTFDLVYRGLSAAPHVRAFIDGDRVTALPLMTSSKGALHPRMVALIQSIIDAETEQAGYRPPADSEALAYVLVRLAEGMLFNQHADELANDLDRMREVLAALLHA